MSDIGIGLVGAGRIAGVHAGAYSSISGARLVAVYDPVQGRATALAGIHGASAAASLEQLLASEEVALVDVCTPTPTHLEAIEAALAAGKDVVTEKPLARTVGEGREAVALAQKSRQLLFVAHVLRFWPEYVAAHDLIVQQRLGKPLSLSTHRLSAMPMWGGWFSDPAQSGGVVLDLQIHDIDFANWCLGRPKTIFSQLIAHSGKSADEVHSVLTYPDAKAEVVASYLMPETYPFAAGFRLVCEAGALEYRMPRPASKSSTRTSGLP
jgi:predicted dehydrogenase